MDKIFTIAEIGINHGGDLDKAKRMVKAAHAAGASMAKFQWYRPAEILGTNSPHLSEAVRCQFHPQEYLELKELCSRIGIEFGCSIFHADQVDIMEMFGLKRYKVASRAALNHELLSEIGKTGKPVIMSVGMSNNFQISQALTALKSNDVTLLYCVCKYPSDISDISLDKMIALRDNFNLKVGFSSHCPLIAPGVSAAEQGASVIEYHVYEHPQDNGCDMTSSISMDDFSVLVKCVREMEVMCLDSCQSRQKSMSSGCVCKDRGRNCTSILGRTPP